MLVLAALLPVAAAAAPTVTIGRATGPIHLDGRLDEPSWADAPAVDDFVQYQPAPGGPAPGRTVVRFLQDDDTLYVSAVVSGADYEVRAHISPREDLFVDDQIGLYLDPFGDARTGVILYVNPYGIQQDIRYAYGQWTMSWSTVFRCEGQLTDDGYVIELAIPFRSLRAPPPRAEGQTWGVMVTRKVPALGTKYAFPPMVPRHPRLFEQAARLVGVRPPGRGTGTELLPVLATQLPSVAAPGGGLQPDPAAGLSTRLRPGLELRQGIGPALGLAATVNPDFSQVEGDVLEIDLNQRFAFYYPEQRPFFLDGVDSFQDAADTLYTRSVVSPIGGLKLSGQAGRLGLGALSAIDTAPGASVHERGAPGFSAAELEDAWVATSFARARQDLADNGYIGFTAADKRALAAPGATALPAADHQLGAADLRLPLSPLWTVDAYGAGSRTAGADATLSGGAGGLTLARTPPLGTGLLLDLDASSPGHRVETGFLTQSGLVDSGLEVLHRAELGSSRLIGLGGVEALSRRELDGDFQERAALIAGLIAGGNHEPTVAAGLRRTRQDGVEIPGWTVDATYEALVSRQLSFVLGGSGARELDFATLSPVDVGRADLELTLRPTTRARADLFLARQWFAVEGAPTRTATRVYARWTHQITREWGARLIASRTADGRSPPGAFGSVLVSYVLHPGTEAYLGGTWSAATEPLAVQQQTLFFKVSRLLRF